MYHGDLTPRTIAIYNQESNEQVRGAHMWVHIKNSYKTFLTPGVYRLMIEKGKGVAALNVKNVIVKANRETIINIQ